LRLENGAGWQLWGSPEAEGFIEKLAAILELKKLEPNGYPKLLFVRREPGDEDHALLPLNRCRPMEKDLPPDGWKAFDLPPQRLWFHGEVPHILCEIPGWAGEGADIEALALALYPLFLRLRESGSMPLHAALVEKNGLGALLAGPSGAGKSTCCRRILPPWREASDDSALVVQTSPGQYAAHPLPTWSEYLFGSPGGRTWRVEGGVRLSAIFFIEQADADGVLPAEPRDAALRIVRRAGEAFRPLFSGLPGFGSEARRGFKIDLLDEALRLTKCVPTFRLRVSLGGRFWEEMEKAMGGPPAYPA